MEQKTLSAEPRRSFSNNFKLQMVKLALQPGASVARIAREHDMNRPGFPGECFICELRLPDHCFRWKH
ncbi:transposase, partial [Escherichia coli]|uniref:transposase n=1 Tax=Escherichia coli TaxID=562 RepID=UPI00113D3BFA